MKARVRPSGEKAGRMSSVDGRGEPLLHAAHDVQNEDPEAFSRRRSIHDGQGAAVGRPREPLVGQALHLPDGALGSAGGRDEAHFRAAPGLVAEEGDPGAVGRPGRAPVPCAIGGQAERLLRADRLDVDVVIVLVLAVPRERHLRPVRRERGLRLAPGVAGERNRFQPDSHGGPGHRDERRTGRRRRPRPPRRARVRPPPAATSAGRAEREPPAACDSASGPACPLAGLRERGP